MPDTIQFSNGNQIVNRYAADGRKLGTEFFTQLAALGQPLVEGQVKKQQYSFGFVDQSGIMYINNFEYKTQYGSASLTSLNKVFNAEGYVDEFANSTSHGLQPNKYNNKPFIEMHGFDTYDFSARMIPINVLITNSKIKILMVS